MNSLSITGVVLTAMLVASTAHAACTGSNGRGWGGGNGAGKFEMTAADKNCRISFPSFINDAAKTRIPASDMKLTRAPASGKIGVVAGQGIIYTPNPGFKGTDRFCTVNTSKEVPRQRLAGCITVTVK